jgi:hypothetical protein
MSGLDPQSAPQTGPWFEAANECRRLATQLVEQAARQPQEAPSRTQELERLIIWMLTPKACDTFDALVVLCKAGWGVEAAVLARVLMETMATAVLINRHPEPFLFLYAESMAKGLRDYVSALESIERTGVQLSPSRLESKASAEGNLESVTPLLEGALGKPAKSDRFAWRQAGPRSGKRRHWHEISIQERMKEAGLGRLYDTDYRLTSVVIHATANIQGDYLEEGPPYTALFGPKTAWVDTVLPKACHHLLLHLLALDATFEMHSEPLIEAQSKELKLLGETATRE